MYIYISTMHGTVLAYGHRYHSASIPDAAAEAEARRYAPICCPGTGGIYEEVLEEFVMKTDETMHPVGLVMKRSSGLE
jgi:hypothetical protein